jgi:hypothetical protein
MSTVEKNNLHGLECWEKGETPKLLIHCGTHGDEYEVIAIVREAVGRFGDDLPNFIFVPEVSPSAVRRRQRHNGRGQDVNRIFLEGTKDFEVRGNVAILERGPFELLVSFHEDPDFNRYYVYDIGVDANPTGLVRAHNRWLKSQGIELLNGVDDPDDPDLGFRFTEGYRRFVHQPDVGDDGMIATYGMNRGLFSQAMLPEVPGRAPIRIKVLLVESFFERVLLPYFNGFSG